MNLKSSNLQNIIQIDWFFLSDTAMLIATKMILFLNYNQSNINYYLEKKQLTVDLSFIEEILNIVGLYFITCLINNILLCHKLSIELE